MSRSPLNVSVWGVITSFYGQFSRLSGATPAPKETALRVSLDLMLGFELDAVLDKPWGVSGTA